MNQATLHDSQLEESSVAALARGAKAASRLLASVPGLRRDAALRAAADAIEERKSEILAANRRDCDDASRAVEAGSMPRAFFARLEINEQSITRMAAGVRQVAA